jgi:DMSO reductase anchor subunit
VRNARLRPKSTVQSATGIKNAKVVQVSRGFTAGAFNLHEFFHGKSAGTLRGVKWGFLVTAFVAPIVLMALGAGVHSIGISVVLLAAACLVQYAGLVAERWFFFAEAKHPQNLYYARVG